MTSMLIVVDPSSGVPVYRQLMDQIKFLIASGRLAPGDELPSTRSLSTDLGVNPMTISKAYSFLERDGIVERRPGKPLAVCRQSDDDLHANRIDQLEQTLSAAVTATHQLEIPETEAIEIFKRLLAEASGEEESQ
jgi:GntR family transcriptional regulator